jgi:energy-coupling factor transporter transmembrane protein EcfT
METQTGRKSQKDAIVLCTILGVAVIAFVSFSYLDSNWRTIIISWLIFCFVAGMLGMGRKIGFGGAFFLSVLLSPIIGLIITLASATLKNEEYKEKMLEIAQINSSNSIADELIKLNELRKEGVLSEEEFTAQKEKLINQ